MNNKTATSPVKGILPVNKLAGWTSFDVVNKVKHLFRGQKVGHLGTLDPMATGVLLVTIGKATKLFDIMQQKTKTYIASFAFGRETDSLDATGKLCRETANIPTEQEIRNVLPKFVGEIEQIPPKFSAKSVGGQRAYDLARNNQEFELKPCKVNICDIELLSYNHGTLQLKIVCGSGTYIRALGRDIAAELNSLATMTDLIRTQVGNFDVKNCIDVSNLDIDLAVNSLVKINDVLRLPELNLTGEALTKLLNGQTLSTQLGDGTYAVISADDTVALAEIKNFKLKMCIYLA